MPTPDGGNAHNIEGKHLQEARVTLDIFGAIFTAINLDLPLYLQIVTIPGENCHRDHSID